MKEKSLPLAVGLNLLLPGIGYMYMGKWIVGIFASLLVIGILATSAVDLLLIVWLGLNLIMAIDMKLLSNKQKKLVQEATTRKCPKCAEMIKREATVCRFCQSPVSAQ